MYSSFFRTARSVRHFLLHICECLCAFLLSASPAGALCIPVSARSTPIQFTNSCCQPDFLSRKQVCFTGISRRYPSAKIQTEEPSSQTDKEEREAEQIPLSINARREEEKAVWDITWITSEEDLMNETLRILLPQYSLTEEITFFDELCEVQAVELPEGVLFHQKQTDIEQNELLITFEQNETDSNPEDADPESLIHFRLLTSHSRDFDKWRKENDPALKEEISLTAVLSLNETETLASFTIPAETDRLRSLSGGTSVYVRKIWKDEGYERKRPSEVTFHLYRINETDQSLEPMGKEYDRILEPSGNEQDLTWENLPDGAYTVTEDPVPGYETVHDTEEYKDSELHIFENTYQNSTSIHLVKNWINEENLPIRVYQPVAFELETWEISAEDSSATLLSTESFILHSDNGQYQWDSGQLPLCSSEGDYYYRIREETLPHWETTYSWNEKTFSKEEWETSAEGLIQEGTVTVTNREKQTEWQLPSTGGNGILPYLFAGVFLMIKGLAGRM